MIEETRLPIHVDTVNARLRSGNVLESRNEALVVPVNCSGIMGQGLAHQFKDAWPGNFEAYAKACKRGRLHIGETLFYPTGRDLPRYIINFPTRRHWREPSSLRYIEMGLIDLAGQVRRLGIRSLAVPSLGCGRGRLNWYDVRIRIARASALMPDTRIDIYNPGWEWASQLCTA